MIPAPRLPPRATGRANGARAGPAVGDRLVRLAARVEEAARAALEEELALDPKPGLVSPSGAGAHRDMDVATFRASLDALRGVFGEAAWIGAGPPAGRVAALRALGIEAEARMLAATRGVNTHRGAIFALGLVAAAAGAATRRASPALLGLEVGTLRAETRSLGARIVRALPGAAESHGARAMRIHGVPGARGEAAAGLPHLFDVALPALRAAIASGADRRAAALQALFALVAVLPDTNLLHRGGAAGLAFAREACATFLRGGGVHRAGWDERAAAIHRAFVRSGLSPGGSADLLAAALLVHRVCPPAHASGAGRETGSAR